VFCHGQSRVQLQLQLQLQLYKKSNEWIYYCGWITPVALFNRIFRLARRCISLFLTRGQDWLAAAQLLVIVLDSQTQEQMQTSRSITIDDLDSPLFSTTSFVILYSQSSRLTCCQAYLYVYWERIRKGKNHFIYPWRCTIRQRYFATLSFANIYTEVLIGSSTTVLLRWRHRRL
jgi:hypothetical protein